MIKFTEIYSSAGQYDSTAETVVADYYLREILVNPRYIMTAVENTSLSDKNKKNPLMDGLDPVIRFTEIKMLSNVGMTYNINVVGALEHTISKMEASA
tara:strand:- start:7 stop:300 length:294 start_codon:yes stop_codon:yes gene_type:complete